ncbi:MAG: glycerate kinase [Phycisphaerales bacterium]|nr:glycerate kinase [Phycisphaerales bacterium]
MPFTPQELAAEHARAMRIVRAVLNACDARRATADAARRHGMNSADGRWVLSIGKAAIGMAEGLAESCGTPDRHLIVTVDGPPAGRLTNILRSDHPLPTQRSLDAGQAVKGFIEEAKAAAATSLTALISGGASSLICEPIPGIELDEYRALVQAMLTAGWDIQRMNTIRRAIDGLKGGGLAALAAPLPIDVLVISDVIGNTLHDIGSGPFVWSPTSPDDACDLLTKGPPLACERSVFNAVSCHSYPRGLEPPRRAVVVLDNADAVGAAAGALAAEGFDNVSRRVEVIQSVEELSWSACAAAGLLQPAESLAWGGEWPLEDAPEGSVGGRCQALAIRLLGLPNDAFVLTLATDGTDGVADPARPAPAGAFVTRQMTFPVVRPDAYPGDNLLRWALAEDSDDPDYAYYRWYRSNSYRMFAHRDANLPPHEPPAHIFTGPTGTNVNDLLIAWRVK